MTETARRVLNALDSLPEAERHEVVCEILRRTALADYGPLDDTDLVALASDVLLELDRDESSK